MPDCLMLTMNQIIHHLDVLGRILKGPNTEIGSGQLRLGEDFINPRRFILIRAAIQIALKGLWDFPVVISLTLATRLGQKPRHRLMQQ